jgi:hypothetical protein
MQRSPQLADRPVAVTEISRHPSAADPSVGQPRIERQRSFEALVGICEPMHQNERAAAQRQGQSVIGAENGRLFGEAGGPLAVDFRSRAEAVRGALPPAPGGNRLRQSVHRSQLFRTLELLERGVATFRGEAESKRQGAQGQADRLDKFVLR